MSRLSHAIVYDADSKEREALVYGFEIDGVKVTSSSDGDHVRATVTASPGEVVVAVMRDDDAAGIPLVRRLAEDATTAQVPRLLLASALAVPDQVAGLSGPSKFLPLPAFVRDVVTAAKLLAAGAASPEESVFEAALSEIGLFFTVRTMVGLGLSGIVEVERGPRKGEVRFHQGEVVAAQVGPLEGPPALHQLLLWEEAAMVLQFRPTVRRGQTFLQGEELLEDCARFLRDFEHATRSTGHAQSLFVQNAEQTAALVDTFPQELLPIQRLFDGHRSLGDVIEDSPFRVFDTLAAVERLVELGTIRRKAIEKPTTGLPGNQRRTREDWLGRTAELGATPRGAQPQTPVHGPTTTNATVTMATPAPAATPAPVTSAPSAASDPAQPEDDASAIASNPSAEPPVSLPAEKLSARGRRSFRRKTGEHAIAPAPSPTSADPNRTSVTASLVNPALAHKPADGSVPITAPSADAPTIAGRAVTGGVLQVRGELRASSSDRLPRVEATEAPSMLIDLGDDLAADVASLSSEQAPTTPAQPPVEPPPAVAAASVPAASAATTAQAADTQEMSAPPTFETAAPPVAAGDQVTPRPTAAIPTPAASAAVATRAAGVQAAEFDTGQHARPPAEMLEAPQSGPSILIDPGFVQEMDAFELAHSAPTPPPVVIQAPRPAEAPPAAEATPPATAGRTNEPVVSFVRGLATARPARSPSVFNAAPTIPVGAIDLGPRPETPTPPAEAPAPVPTPTAAVGDAAAPAAAAPATATAVSAATDTAGVVVATPGRSPSGSIGTKRRASGEFDALESDFFARESELYKKETLENFEDLDATKGPPNRGR